MEQQCKTVRGYVPAGLWDWKQQGQSSVVAAGEGRRQPSTFVGPGSRLGRGSCEKLLLTDKVVDQGRAQTWGRRASWNLLLTKVVDIISWVGVCITTRDLTPGRGDRQVDEHSPQTQGQGVWDTEEGRHKNRTNKINTSKWSYKSIGFKSLFWFIRYTKAFDAEIENKTDNEYEWNPGEKTGYQSEKHINIGKFRCSKR